MIERVYGEFERSVMERARPRRLPVSVQIEVTHRCPLACAHCYCNLPMTDQRARSEELTLEEHCRLLDELAEAGCLWVTYTGGEIFARPDFLQIHTYAKRKGMLVSLYTNGTLITRPVADYLAEWRPYKIEITLYGRTRETYERVTGVAGSYDRCLRGIHLLLERRLPLVLKTMAVTINQHEIAAMRQYAEELGVRFRLDALVNPRTDCSRSPLAVRLTPEEVVRLDLEDPRRSAAWIEEGKKCRPRPAGRYQDQELYYCDGGINGFAVDPYGRMSLCVVSHQEEYDLRHGSLREGWEHFLLQMRRKRLTRPSRCTACALRDICPTCPAYAELDSGDPQSPVDFLCAVTHLRARAYGISVPPHGDCPFCDGGSEQRLMVQGNGRQKISPLSASPVALRL
jgi:radical SAM protein with 4Fe4S-binding SPASM domain